MMVDIDDRNHTNDADEKASSNYSCDFQDRQRGSCENDSHGNDCWEDLRQLLSDFHHLVDVELPSLLQRSRASAARMDTGHHRHVETHHHFDLRRCFRTMQELLLREDLLELLDGDRYADGDEDKEYSNNSPIRGGHDNHAGKSGDNNNVFLLLQIFSDDLVKLSTISDFDGTPHNDSNNGIHDFGVREIHRSLVVLAANRFPINATLVDDQISQLLSRVMSLIDQESCSMNERLKHRGENFNQLGRHQRVGNNFEPLNSLLAWLNREMTVERLSRGVLLNSDEAAMALKIPLEFLEMTTKTTATSSSFANDPYAVLPQQTVLSLRIMIDLLLGALDSIVREDFGDGSNSQNSNGNTRFGNSSSPISLRKWMMASCHREHQEKSLSGHDFEDKHCLSLVRLLDRYAFELIQETLELLRPPKKAPPSQVRSHRRQNTSQRSTRECRPAAGQKRDRPGGASHHDIYAHSIQTKPTSNSRTSSKSQKQRVIKALQYAAMTTNLFSIMEIDKTTVAESTIDTSGSSSIFVGLSRSLWQALARFIIDEVDCLDDRSLHNGGDVEDDDAEDCRVAATDVLFRLTKTQVQTIVFHDQNKDTKKNKVNDKICHFGINEIQDHTVAPPPLLSEEEFSIVVTTILRLLGHSEEYWTAEAQSWVATLLQVREDHDNNHRATMPITSTGTSGVDVAAKLRRVLHATLLCTTYVPDPLPLEEQCRVNESLKELLVLSTSSMPEVVSRRERNNNGYPLVGPGAGGTARDGEDIFVDDPWSKFWASRH